MFEAGGFSMGFLPKNPLQKHGCFFCSTFFEDPPWNIPDKLPVTVPRYPDYPLIVIFMHDFLRVRVTFRHVEVVSDHFMVKSCP